MRKKLSPSKNRAWIFSKEKTHCSSCKKEIEAEEVFPINVYFNNEIPCEHELCIDCYKRIKLEITQLFNWRNRLR